MTFQRYLIEVGIRSGSDFLYSIDYLYSNIKYFKQCHKDNISPYKALTLLDIPDWWNGFIYEISEDFIHCTLRRGYHLDKELDFPITNLTEDQKLKIDMGQCLKYDIVNDKIDFSL